MAEHEGIRQRSQAASWVKWLMFGLVLGGMALWDRRQNWGWLDTFGHVLGWVTTILWMGVLAVLWAVALIAWLNERKRRLTGER